MNFLRKQPISLISASEKAVLTNRKELDALEFTSYFED
jgi:hypothetical protein